MSGWRDEYDDVVFWTVFATGALWVALMCAFSSEHYLGPNRVALEMLTALGLAIIPVALYLGMGARRREVIFKAIRRLGLARAEARFATFQSRLRKHPIVWWSIVILGRVGLAFVLGYLALLFATLVGEDDLSGLGLGLVIGGIVIVTYLLFDGKPMRWVRRIIHVVGELTF